MSEISRLLIDMANLLEGSWEPERNDETGALDLLDAMWCAHHGPNGMWALATRTPDVRGDLAKSALCLAALHAIAVQTGMTPRHSEEALARVVVWHSWPGRTEADVLDVLVAAAGIGVAL